MPCLLVLGFILLRGVLSPENLPQAQAAWSAAQAKAEAAWMARRSGLEQSQQLYFDLRDLMALDDVFIDMIDSPALVPVMSRLCGTPEALDPDKFSTVRAAGYTGCMRLGDMGGRIVPSDGDTDGYTRWHHDQPLPDDAANPNYRTVKVFVGIWDLPANGGATSVVPVKTTSLALPKNLSVHCNRRCELSPQLLLTSACVAHVGCSRRARIECPRTQKACWHVPHSVAAAETSDLMRCTRPLCRITSRVHFQLVAQWHSTATFGTLRCRTPAV